MSTQIKNELRRSSWLIALVVVMVATIVSVKLVDKPKASWESYGDEWYSTAYQGDFINEIAGPAQNIHAETQLFPSIIIAQAILESDWGQSELATSANNLFGIKGEHNNQSVIMRTDEYIDGERITIDDQFKKYDNLQQGMEDHLVFLKGASYQPVLSAANYREAALAIQAGGYATDPRYADKLIELIEQFGLNQYDS
ncbi:glycoside hydrolase family 73 protein [Vagococcus sp. BWB3-3]|uniref:Glycoside hydrolase family 73 protein n=1 Tax=Vagococcus allomyrinae TaxID=2794353 RepID=A0A940SSZ7_9ENTE|nr:glycoside hydrolase family 73 protein [Vagococcus allomyrinae]MBP1042552.1 glycoside hydrolase family 73 protein [Vagococcus allomyrinae]